MQQAGAPFWPPCSLRRGGAACVAIEKERGAWEVGRFHPDKQNWCQKQKKTATTSLLQREKTATTSSKWKLDALRSGGAVKLPRSDLDKKDPLCKLIRNSRESE
jgi:hypothetical protein